MEQESNKSALSQLFQTFFLKHWPVWVGGILLGVLNVFLFMIKSPWGGSGGYNNWGENIYQALGFFGIENVTPTSASLYGMLNILIILGAFVGALLAKEFALRIPPIGELIKGFIGGGLMAIGAKLGLGCTIGGFFSGVPALSGGAILLTVGLFLGTLVALKYLMWEMEHLPGISSGKTKTLLAASRGQGAWQKWLGFIVVIIAIIIAYSYFGNNDIMGWFVIIGLMLGLICQRSRFCIVASFRDPFMTGKSSSTIGIIAGLLIGLIGFTIIKQFGIGAGDIALRSRELTWVFPNFWLRAPIGGFIFGLGMTIAGGCAVGTLWRFGEGQVKLWAAALGFLLLSPIAKNFIEPGFVKLLPHSTNFRNFMPDYIGYIWSVIIVLAILLIWYLFVKWNERTGKFSAY
ncbi:MAG: YeeE/YedE thiosulfate transporter family protein [candidate division Zixibacteria bacterium]|nr:YeeE/YedE thiosulfate transporter family protein [candidate division Zixibacteria bacterium]